MAVAMQSLFPERTWDEDIVPALRKRLEGESLVLSKRMSVQSNLSGDEGQNTLAGASSMNAWRPTNGDISEKPQPTQYGSAEGYEGSSSSRQGQVAAARPSAIPRPSLTLGQHSSSSYNSSDNPDMDQITDASASNTPHLYKQRTRARTISTPQPFEREGYVNGRKSQKWNNLMSDLDSNALPTPTSSRSNSPMPFIVTNGRPNDYGRSRIPRPNTGHQVSHTNYGMMLNGDRPLESPAFQRLESNQPELLREQPLIGDLDTSRPSMEEEQPFEHWYRGDISRSGGVGEIKVGKRKEMLDIANYGHHTGHSPRPNSTFAVDASLADRGGRKRAGSVGERGSVYDLDESGRAVTEWVIDEMPLTDGEGSLMEQEVTIHPAGDRQNQLPTPTDTHAPVGVARSYHKPSLQAGRRPIEPAPLPGLPNGLGAASSAYPAGPSRSFTAPLPSTDRKFSGMSAVNLGAQQAYKRGRTLSKPSQNKKAKAQSQPMRNGMDDRLQVPNSESERPLSTSLVDAIPSWSVPIAKDGNWDEVVLPVVARRMGLEGYEEVDGSPPPQNSASDPVTPAPGTFGYDHSKYRPPRDDRAEAIPMDEFGGRRPPDSQSPVPVRAGPQRSHVIPPYRNTNRRDSAPFSSYTVADPNRNAQRYETGNPQPISLQQPFTGAPNNREKRNELEDDNAGCCGKCVIM